MRTSDSFVSFKISSSVFMLHFFSPLPTSDPFPSMLAAPLLFKSTSPFLLRAAAPSSLPLVFRPFLTRMVFTSSEKPPQLLPREQCLPGRENPIPSSTGQVKRHTHTLSGSMFFCFSLRSTTSRAVPCALLPPRAISWPPLAWAVFGAVRVCSARSRACP
jgi:hypothetical protein